MPISNRNISTVLASYLERYPEETELLSEPMRLLSRGEDFASRQSFPMHVTAGALLVRGAEILLVKHRAYGIVLQPGGHLEPADVSLAAAAERELVEETGRATSGLAGRPAKLFRFRPAVLEERGFTGSKLPLVR